VTTLSHLRSGDNYGQQKGLALLGAPAIRQPRLCLLLWAGLPFRRAHFALSRRLGLLRSAKSLPRSVGRDCGVMWPLGTRYGRLNVNARCLARYARPKKGGAPRTGLLAAISAKPLQRNCRSCLKEQQREIERELYESWRDLASWANRPVLWCHSTRLISLRREWHSIRSSEPVSCIEFSHMLHRASASSYSRRKRVHQGGLHRRQPEHQVVHPSGNALAAGLLSLYTQNLVSPIALIHHALDYIGTVLACHTCVGQGEATAQGRVYMCDAENCRNNNRSEKMAG
jgi:hypothetical protein